MLEWLFGKTNTRPVSAKGVIRPYTMNSIQTEWRTINSFLVEKRPSQLRQALITADKTLDNALGDLVTGQTMGERLKNAPHIFEKNLYNKIWSAHKVRNALIHEAGYEPPAHIMTYSISTFKEALNFLGIKNI